MAEPRTQVEIQLGHMCNNRCVFCVSGQKTGLGEAKPLPVEPLLERVREARAAGHAKITLLGGEPTLQPGFLDVVRECVRLGFEEIVIFTNGVRTGGHSDVIDEVIATGGRFVWRVSIQGATKESHERTTRKPGSFDRIVRTLERLHERKQRITVNMCVVTSNFESVPEFPALLARYGVEQLHLDMMRPLDAGERSEEEMRAMLPRYGDLAAPLRAMIAGFPDGFDVNVGNLPFCIAPDLAPWIHHDGEHTETIAVDGDHSLSRPWDKYFVKRRDKAKPDTCRTCAYDARCSGIFETYDRFYGTTELVPVTTLHPGVDVGPPPSRIVASGLERLRRAAPFGDLQWHAEHLAPSGARADITLIGPAGERATLWIEDRAGKPTGGYRLDTPATEALEKGLRAAVQALRGARL
jgi:MoaA/NifB/PqqE/SkfB family radical SAM enzyme